MGPLTGGEKDLTPPKLENVEPKNRSVNISPEHVKIEFTFNERIDVKTVMKSLIVNPSVTELPDVRAVGKKMIVEFNDPLKPNTTYQLQFGNSIGDVHENNKYKSLSYIFSTGPTIDSNTLSGSTSWALSLNRAKDISILLFSNLSDTAPLKTKASYYTKTDSAGNYSLSAIKRGTYQIIALADKNSNGNYDLGEGVGFIGRPVEIDGKDTAVMTMSTPKGNKSFIKKKAQAFWGLHRFILNDTLPGAYILFDDKKADAKHISYETRNDTLEVYYKGIYDTRLTLYFKNKNTAFDTVSLEVPKQSKVDSTVNKFSKRILASASKKNFGVDNDDVFFNFSLPVIKIDSSKCYLIHDSTYEKPLFTQEESNLQNRLVTPYLPSYKRRLKNKLLQDKNYTMVFYPGSITNYWNVTNGDTIKAGFKTLLNEDIGTIKIKFNLPEPIHDYVLQLMDAKGGIVATYEGVNQKKNETTFYNLPAADYSLRLIDDADANKKFSAADYYKKTQAEDVYYYTKPLKVPAGWDVEADWNF